MTKILVVDDDRTVARLIEAQLQELCFDVQLAVDGQSGLARALAEQYDLIILDVMLDNVSGLDICRQVRINAPHQAILIVTSKSSETDRVLGLELGADDYMTKPFSVREFQARVRSILRRVNLLKAAQQAQALVGQPTAMPTSEATNLQVIGKLEIDPTRHQIRMAGELLQLTATEYELLRFLASHPGQVFSRSQLLASVWGYHHSGYEHTVNSHINRLRNKLERDVATPRIVQTVWGVGYKFNEHGVN
ncbi:response regulator transcription factor [Thalassotalea mangrovi]|uniref:Phosphate regulon transcriptional regulatory protein PhoB n=1 Tax=Thalassotalea mangrovi TaxID=2572245 RepID=A0A4U1B769_9GAMM|nr:response regulator transcription factor [Thalassotalea mangrovi]TKB45775.1 response regulator transcription factor [Thalassotalea mangrovi]